MELEQRTNLYQPLSGKLKGKINKEEEVKKLLDQYVTDVPTQRALSDMKPVYLDPNVEIPPKEKTINKKSKRLNARQRRQLGIYDIPKEALKYENFVPLHDLWLGYMKELYGSGGQDIKTFAQKLLKADFHGAIFTVLKSINPVLVGISGIVIQETQNIFSIITKDNKLKKVPKANTVFTMKLDVCAHTFTLYGQQFICRSAERAARKFKAKPTIDI